MNVYVEALLIGWLTAAGITVHVLAFFRIRDRDWPEGIAWLVAGGIMIGVAYQRTAAL